MNKRNQIADSIFNLLPLEEENAMKMWSENLDTLQMNSRDLPLIDVLTSVYNSEKYIDNAIKSILWQSYPNVNLIIVTDPCTDATVEIIKTYQEKYPNILLIENKEHKGFIESLNIGLNASTGKYIVRMDLDDLIHPLKFEKQFNFLSDHLDCDVVSSGMIIFNEKSELKSVTYREDYELHKITLFFFSPISHAASMFKGEVLRNIQYQNGYNYAEDYNIWSRLLDKYKTAVLQEPLYLYRTHSEQTTNERNKSKIVDTLKKIISDILSKVNLVLNEADIDFYIHSIILSNGLNTK
ncbi:MAG: glycosyltransferase [Bacteroidia bacterium]|nr:glycosyltransferase [Bacteroidia bacterium]